MAASTDTEAFVRALRGEHVVIIANPGTNEERFTVSKDIICSKSRYFDKVFNGNFKESQQKEVELHDIDAPALQAALYCIYHGSLPEYETKSTDDAHAYLVHIWLVADRLILPTVQNRAMEQLCYELGGSPREELDMALIRTIYVNTAAGSMLRKLACYNVAAYVVSCNSLFPGPYAECFEELEGFGLKVISAIRHILDEAGMEHELPWRTTFNESFFMMSE